MRVAIRNAGVAAAAILLWSSTVPAAPIPVQPMPIVSEAQLVREERGSSRTASTKAWLRKKKNQTERWVGRQKQKLKNLVD